MGVKDLWSILSPICERKPLWELQGKSVAIDLSGWVCDSQNLTENHVQPRMYLRNLFFRASCLLLMDVKPVFVLDGVAPALKHDTMSRRNQQQYGKSQSQKSQEQPVGKRGSRKRFMSILKQCKELLDLMGVPCLQSQGEAEALCAQLNMAGVVEGCISQDGDCFLYGAQTVYRNFTISHSGTGGSSAYSIDVYEMAAVVDRLSLSRRKLIALSILCGCDYNEKGVAGVGKETALKFFDSVEKEDILDRLYRWCSDPYFDQMETQRLSMSRKDLCDKCGHKGKKVTHEKSGCNSCQLSQGCIQDTEGLRGMDSESRKIMLAELSLRRKALQDPEFPYQQVIDEFMASGDEVPKLDWKWGMPQVEKLVNFAVKMLAWTEDYAVEKFLPLASRWHLKHDHTGSLRAQSIKRQCVRKGAACLEVEWGSVAWWPGPLVTVEPVHLVEAKYPDLVEDFRAEKEAKRRKPKNRGDKKTVATKRVPHECTAGQDGGCLSHLCQFVSRRRGGADVKAVEQKLTALHIDDDKENNVPRSGPNKDCKPTKCTKLFDGNKENVVPRSGPKKICQPTKCTKPRVKLKSLPVKTDKCLGRGGTQNHCLAAVNELSVVNKGGNKNCSFDADLCDSNSLDHSHCSKCEDDDNIDLSFIISSIVGRKNVSPTPSPITDLQSSPEMNLASSTLSAETFLSDSICVQSTPKCFTNINFSLGTSRFLAMSDDSLL